MGSWPVDDFVNLGRLCLKAMVRNVVAEELNFSKEELSLLG